MFFLKCLKVLKGFFFSFKNSFFTTKIDIVQIFLLLKCCRVSSYWSYMIIKPYREFNESGIEFSLTYFDDPGINIPSGISSWVAMSGNYIFSDK